MTGLTVSHPLRRVESALNAHPTAAFFTLTVSISWGLWIPLFVAFPSATSLVMIPGAFGPALAAVAVLRSQGKVGSDVGCRRLSLDPLRDSLITFGNGTDSTQNSSFRGGYLRMFREVLNLEMRKVIQTPDSTIVEPGIKFDPQPAGSVDDDVSI
jgi:hypothetical protein